MADSGKGRPAAGGKAPTAEQVVARFNRLRQEQRGLASKAAELELELNEHSLVIETLRDVDPTRKCYRMVGGILVERTVKEVLPALESNKEQVWGVPTRVCVPRRGSRFPPPYTPRCPSPSSSHPTPDQQNHRDAEPAAAGEGPGAQRVPGAAPDPAGGRG
uniref:Prefoldin subunit 2 n=1 Tax=Strigops habroptila TaxID=2489341 RepID=A0A672UM49_STRHB